MRWHVALSVIVLVTSCTEPNPGAGEPLDLADGGANQGPSGPDLGPTPAGTGLLLGAADWARLGAQMRDDPTLAPRYQRLKSWVEERMWDQPPVYALDSLGRLDAIPDRVLGLVYGLSLVYRVEQESLYAQRAIAWLRVIAGYQDWNSGHFADTGRLAHATAIGLDWLAPVLPPDQRGQLQGALWAKALKPALACYEQPSSCGWVAAGDSENTIANTGVGLGALVLARQQPALAGGLLDQATRSLRGSLAAFAPDGGWAQGLDDWNATTLHLALLLAAIERAAGRAVELEGIPGLVETGLFPIYLAGPTGAPFNYADASGRAGGPQLHWWARRFGRPVFAGQRTDGRREDRGPLEGMLAALELLWFEADGRSPGAAALPLQRHFRGAGVASLRGGWHDDALFVAFKAGDNRGRHGHLDQGSFVLDALGQRWALDLGPDDPRLPGYHQREGARWDYYRLRAEGHNTLVIDPGPGPDQDPGASAQLGALRSFVQGSSIGADLTALYADRAQRVWRWLALLDREQLLLHDEVVTARPATVHWAMHTAATIEAQRDEGRTLVLRQGDARLELQLLAPAGSRFSVREARPAAGSPDPPGQQRNAGIRKLTVELSGVTEVTIEVRFTPLA